jgi:type IV pilus assembly protein PilO
VQGGTAMNQAILELLREKKRTLIMAVVLLLLNIVLYTLSAAYLEPRIAASQTMWTDLRQRVAVAGRADVATVYRRGLDDLKKLVLHIPVKRQFPRVLGDILDAAASSAVITGNISYKPLAIKDRDLLAYGISMTVGGRYAAVKSFLGDLQKYSEMIVIDGISLSKSDLFEENVVMDLRLTVYLQSKEGA